MIKTTTAASTFILIAMLFLSISTVKAQKNTYETDSQGKTIYIKIDPAFSINTISADASFIITTRKNVIIPVISKSFTSNLITITLQNRLIYDDGSDIKLSFNSGLITYTSGAKMTYFSNKQVVNKVEYLYKSDQTAVSNWISSKKVQLGVSDFTGGYIAQLLLTPNGTNSNAPQYGRGIQFSMRSGLHGGSYVPNNAGNSADVGVLGRCRTTVSENGTGGRVEIDEFNLNLFLESDFLENETAMVTDNNSKDGGNKDYDNVDEKGKTYVDELRTELLYNGYWEDASNLSTQGIAIFKTKNTITYNETPKAILQFNKNATDENGNGYIDENFRVKDISPNLPGNQEGQDDDISGILFKPFGIRPYVNKGFKYAMWIEAGQTAWSSLDLYSIYKSGANDFQRWKVKSNLTNINLFPFPSKVNNFKDSSIAASGIINQILPSVLVSDGTDPNTSKAICVVELMENKNGNFQIIDASGNPIYEEDRLATSYIEADIRGNATTDEEYFYIRQQNWATGLMAPNKFNNGEKDRLNVTVLYLFGTPNQIKAAYQEIVQNLTKVAILSSDNKWYHNYKTNEFTATSGTINNGTYTNNQATPTTNGNESAIVSKFIKNSGTSSSIKFNLPNSLTTLSKAVFKIRVYTPANTTLTNNNLKLMLRKDGQGTTQLQVSNDIVVFDQWVEYTFDFSALTMKETDYNEIYLFFAQPDSDLDATNNVYYFDAFQGPIETKLPEKTENNTLKIYPNPVTDSFQINTEEPVKSIMIYTIDGKLVKILEPNAKYDLSNLKPGTYLGTIHFESGTETIKIQKK